MYTEGDHTFCVIGIDPLRGKLSHRGRRTNLWRRARRLMSVSFFLDFHSARPFHLVT